MSHPRSWRGSECPYRTRWTALLLVKGSVSVADANSDTTEHCPGRPRQRPRFELLGARLRTIDHATPRAARRRGHAVRGRLFGRLLDASGPRVPVHRALPEQARSDDLGLRRSRPTFRPWSATLRRRLPNRLLLQQRIHQQRELGMTRGFEHVDDIWRVTHPRGVSLPRLSQRIKALEQRGTPPPPPRGPSASRQAPARHVEGMEERA